MGDGSGRKIRNLTARCGQLSAVRLRADRGTVMLLMFGVGAGNLGWMLLLGGVMAVEKNMPWGRRLSTPLGLFLIGGGVLITILRFL